MAYPTNLDSFTNPTSTDNLNTSGVEHDVQHANSNDAIEAIEGYVGISASTDTATVTGKLSKLSGGSQYYVPKKSSATDFDYALTHESQYGSATGTISASTLTVNFLGASFIDVSFTGDFTLATSNRAAGRSVVIRLVNSSGADRSITWGSHKVLGSIPSALPTGKQAQMTLTCWGTNEADVQVGYAAEP